MDKEGVLGIVNEMRDPLASVARAPDHVGAQAGLEWFAMPVGGVAKLSSRGHRPDQLRKLRPPHAHPLRFAAGLFPFCPSSCNLPGVIQ